MTNKDDCFQVLVFKCTRGINYNNFYSVILLFYIKTFCTFRIEPKIFLDVWIPSKFFCNSSRLCYIVDWRMWLYIIQIFDVWLLNTFFSSHNLCILTLNRQFIVCICYGPTSGVQLILMLTGQCVEEPRALVNNRCNFKTKWMKKKLRIWWLEVTPSMHTSSLD